MEYLQRIKSIVSDQLGVSIDILNTTTTKEDLGLDSLDFVGLAVLLEDEFNIEIDDDELDSLTTLGELAELVAQRSDPELI